MTSQVDVLRHTNEFAKISADVMILRSLAAQIGFTSARNPIAIWDFQVYCSILQAKDVSSSYARRLLRTVNVVA
jgi:hypothetical protein